MKGILIFLVVFGILVFVHEFGHFIVAKTVVLQLDDQNKVKRIDASGSQMPIEGIPVQVNSADLVDALTIQGYENGDEDQLKTYSVDHDATIIEQNGTELLIAPRDTQQ